MTYSALLDVPSSHPYSNISLSPPPLTLFILQAFCPLWFTFAYISGSQRPAAPAAPGRMVKAQMAEAHPQVLVPQV